MSYLLSSITFLISLIAIKNPKQNKNENDVTWLVFLCQFKCSSNSYDKEQIRCTCRGTVPFLKEFEAIDKLPKDFHSALPTLMFHSDSNNILRAMSAQWDVIFKTKIKKEKIWKMLSFVKEKIGKNYKSRIKKNTQLNDKT